MLGAYVAFLSRAAGVILILATFAFPVSLTAAPSAKAADTTTEPTASGAKAGAETDTAPTSAAAKDSSSNEERYSLSGGKRLELKFTTTAVLPARLYVRVNHGPFLVVASGVLRLFEDGLYQIGWYAEDSMGKRSAVQERFIRIDSTPPELSYTVRTTAPGQAALELRAFDLGVGGAKIEWRATSDDAWKPYTSPISYSSEQPIAAQARATDDMGNTSEVLSISVALNRVPPRVVTLFREPFSRTDGDGRIYVVTREIPIPDGLDRGNLELVEEGRPPRKLAPGSTLKFPSDGKHRLVFRVTDEHGNTIDTAVEVIVDTRAPRSRPIQLDTGGAKE